MHARTRAGRVPPSDVDALLGGVLGLPPTRRALGLPLLDAAEARSYAAGEVVVTEGEGGEELFLVVEGEAELTGTSRGRRVLLAMIGPGEVVGELAASQAGRTRTATLTAVTELRVLALRFDFMEAFLVAHPEARAALRHHSEQLLIARFIKDVVPFSGLEDHERRALAQRVQIRRLSAGEPIVKAGDPGETCFLLRSGRAVVLRDGDVGDAVTQELEPGAVIGEGAVLTGEPRSATVRAISDCELVELRREDVLEVAQRREDVASELSYLHRLRSRPCRGSQVISETRDTATGESITTLKNPDRHSYFRVSERGRFVWERLDGSRDLRELTLEYFEAFQTIDPRAVTGLVASLARAGMLEGSGATPTSLETRNRGRLGRLALRARRLVLWRRDFESVDRIVTVLYQGGIRWLYTRPAQIVLGVVAVTGLIAFAAVLAAGSGELRRHPELAAFVLPGILISLVVHEAAHALTTKAFGREVPRGGIAWFWFRPVVYVDTSNMWFAGPRERVLVSLAGPYSGVVLGGLLSIAAVVADGQGSVVLWSVALPIYASALVNLSPFLELDGYHVVSDLLDKPNLREDATRALGDVLRGGMSRDAWQRQRLLLLYSVGSLLYLGLMAAFVVVVLQPTFAAVLDGVLTAGAADTVAWVAVGVQIALVLAVVVDEVVTREIATH